MINRVVSTTKKMGSQKLSLQVKIQMEDTKVDNLLLYGS